MKVHDNQCVIVDAKDLIRRLLIVDKKTRYTAIDVLCHQWIISVGGSKDLPENLPKYQETLREDLITQGRANLQEWRENRSYVFANHNTNASTTWGDEDNLRRFLSSEIRRCSINCPELSVALRYIVGYLLLQIILCFEITFASSTCTWIYTLFLYLSQCWQYWFIFFVAIWDSSINYPSF